MTSYFELTKMTEEQLEQELVKAKRRVRKAKEDVSIIRDFLKLKKLEAAAEKPEIAKPENMETKKPEKLADGYLDLKAANFVDD